MATVVSSLAVEIGAEIAGLQRGLRRADNSLDDFVTSARRQTMALGTAMTAGVTLPLAGLAVGAARAAMQWESAFAGVRKTVDATEAEFDSLARGLRDMATGASGSPVAGLENAAVTLAGVAEAAGQLGIAQEHLLGFTETMAMLGMATNLTAEEAAFSLAQFANITQMPVENIDRLGATIVALGNNSATTERDIVAFAQRLAGAGKGAGLTESNILALSAAMASVGLNAEAGGTAMTMVMNAITKAVAGGGAELEDFAALSGWSAEEFAQWWRGEPISAIEAFIGGLSKLDNEQQVLMLDQLGLDGIRVADTLRRMAGNTDVLTRSITIANEAWGENNALVNEAEQRFMTTEAQLNLLGNNLKDVGITIGSILLPPINNLIAGIVPLLRWVGQLDPAIVQVGLAFVAAAAAAGPLLIVVGALLSPVGLVAGGIAAAAVAIAAFKDEILNALPWLDDLLEGAGRLFDMFGAGDAQQAADGAARAVQSVPKIFDIEIPAGQTVWDAWAASYKDQFPDWQEFRGLAEEALSAQGLTFTTIPGGGLSIQFPMGTEIVSVGRPGRQMLPFDEASDTIAGMNFGDKLRAAFGGTELSGIVDEIVVQFERLGGIGTAIQAAWNATEGLSFGARIVAVFNSEDVSAAIDSFIAPLRSIPEKLGAALSGVFGGGEASGRMVAGGADMGGGGGLLDGLFAGLMNFTPPDLSVIAALIGAAFQPLIDGITGAWASIQPHLQPFVDGITGFFAALSETDTSGLDNIAGVLAGVAGAAFNGLTNLIGTLIDLGGSAIGGILEGLGNALPLVGQGISAIVSAFSIAAETGDVGLALGSLGEGIGSLGEALLGFGAGAANGLIEVIGKLTGLELPDIQTIVQGITDGLAALGGAFDNARLAIDLILQGIATSITTNILEPVAALWANVQTAIAPFLEGIQTGIVTPLAGLWESVSDGIMTFWGNLAQIFGTIDAEVIQPIAQAIRDVQTAINTLTSGLGAWSGAADNAGAAVGMVTSGQVTPGDFFNALGNAISLEFGGGGSVPGFASGISYVPNTMLAMLHGGERVLTRDENREYSRGGGAAGTFVINAYGGSPHELARMVQRAIREGDR